MVSNICADMSCYGSCGGANFMLVCWALDLYQLLHCLKTPGRNDCVKDLCSGKIFSRMGKKVKIIKKMKSLKFSKV